MFKENKIKSKIPIPLKPLPLLSDNVLVRNCAKVDRHPLETIYKEPENAECHASINKNKVRVDKINNNEKKLKRIDSKNVTIRKKTEDLDWNYEVFNDSVQDNEKTDVEGQSLLKDNQCGESAKASTPALKSPLEPARVKNIKKSLKRPHSRELQGISPIVPDESETEIPRRRLKFNEIEDNQKVSLIFDNWEVSYNNYLNQYYVADIFGYLFTEEHRQISPPLCNRVRSCIINWLVKVHGPGGSAVVVQIATWYFESTLLKRNVSTPKLQMLATACYWISLKIHGRVVSAKKLVKLANQAFSTKTLIAAEALIMKELKFPNTPKLPQEFITYLSWICDTDSKDIETAATIIYMASLVICNGIRKPYPSVSGAASVRNAILLLNRKNLFAILEANDVYKMAVKKTKSFHYVCAMQMKSLQIMAAPGYEYNALLEIHKAFITDKIDMSVVNSI